MTSHAQAGDGTSIAFDLHRAGEGDDERADALPPILFVHGFASDAAVTWEGTGWVRALQRAGRDVVTLDLRGHGRSGRPVDATAYAPEVLAADLLAVLDAAGIAQADVVGYSMGSRVVSAFARLAPSRIRRLVFGGAGPLEVFATWRHDELERMLHTGDFTGNPVAQVVVGPALAAGADPAVLLACIDGMTGAALLRPVAAPLLFVVGELDPVGVGAAALAAEWGEEFVSIPGRNHINVLTARAFKDAVLAFLG